MNVDRSARALRFTADDAERAYEAWGANCGPGAIAAVLDMTLDELRPAMGDFEKKGFATPTLVTRVLDRLGVRFRTVTPPGHTLGPGCGWTLAPWPEFGLAFVQWEGPWTAPGVPPRAAYRHTHWVGARAGDFDAVAPDKGRQNSALKRGREIFDINVVEEGGWVPADEWAEKVVPWLLKTEPRATGKWHLRLVIEIDGQGVQK